MIWRRRRLLPVSARCRGELRYFSIGQTHDKCNCDVQAGKILWVKHSDSLANPLPTYRNGFINHYLRARLQSILFIGIYCYAKVGCIDKFGGHLTNDQ